MLGVKHVVLAVNKMDMVDYDEGVFASIVADFARAAGETRFRSLAAIPMSARYGDNVTAPSARMGWHRGPCLLDYLETVDVEDNIADAAFRFPIQWVNRPDLDFRGFSGTLVSGRVQVGDEVIVADTGKATRIARIVTMDGDLDSARAFDSVTLVFTDEIDAARGDVLCAPNDRPTVVEQFAAHIFWIGEERMLPGRSYLIKLQRPHRARQRDGDEA